MSSNPPHELAGLKAADIAGLPLGTRQEILALLQGLQSRRKYNRAEYLYPEKGPLKRELYPKHVEFFAAGSKFQERLNMSGNRCGKTLAGAYEIRNHLTGDYPHWWPGRVFDQPTDCWAAGKDSQTTRDIIQLALMGPEDDIGSGLLPRHRIKKTTPKHGGVAGSLDQVWVEHNSGGTSLLGYKYYAQGRKSFEGTAKDAIWFDEECPMDVYAEALMRILTTSGIVYTTFTPLQGLTELVLSFLPQEYSFREAA